MNTDIKSRMNNHNKYLSYYATKDEDAIYLSEEEKDFRGTFFHDIDRIIYSLAFIRYQDKTQVFVGSKHDHVSRRMIHVQYVSKIARTIGRALGLNEDLIEAASLAHDLGHTPFGHQGEAILNKLSLKYKEGFFNHNVESVRNLMFLENYGKGLNVSLQVLDAVMCHNGEMTLGKYEPRKKTIEEFFLEYQATYKDKNALISLQPMTLEGCVVRVSDLIAYLGRDIDDAIRMKLIKRDDIPQKITKVLGSTTREIVNACITDIIKMSWDKNYIKLSEEVYQAIEELKKFNYQNIYNKAMSEEYRLDLENKFERLFLKYLEDIKNNNQESLIISSYLNNMSEEYRNNNTPTRIVIDYIAGMTDDFFLREAKKLD